MEQQNNKNKKSTSNRVGNKFNKIRKSIQDTIKGQDRFGQDIKLRFNGDDTHKTIGGALISVSVMFVLALFLFVKFAAMVDITDWSIST